MKRRALSIVLSVILIVSMLPVYAFADGETVHSGTCGDALVWTFDESTGELEITGTGDMSNYQYYSAAPWSGYASSLTSVVIGSGVTSIGDYAFRNMPAITSVDIPDTVTYIGYNAFAGCTQLSDVDLPAVLTVLQGAAFTGCTSITSITILQS